MINSESIKKKNANNMQCLVHEMHFSQVMMENTLLSYRHNELRRYVKACFGNFAWEKSAK
jgi:hypothetical protein